jgi:hypothetical protein
MTMVGKMKVAIMGCGALGSYIATMINRPGIDFLLVDDDKVEVDNLSTSAYSAEDVGIAKTVALGTMLYNKYQSSEVTMKNVEFGDNGKSAKLILEYAPDIVIDCFDNYLARNATWRCNKNILHVGLNAERIGIVEWDETFEYMEPTFERGDNPVCTHELGKMIVLKTSVIAADVIEVFLRTGEKIGPVVTSTYKTVTEIRE